MNATASTVFSNFSDSKEEIDAFIAGRCHDTTLPKKRKTDHSGMATVTNKKKKDNSKHTVELQLLEGLSRRYSPEATAAEATTEVRRL